MTRLKEKYQKDVIPALQKEFGYKNVMAVPRIEKVVVNMGLGEATSNAKLVEMAETLNLYRQHGPSAALDLIRTDIGKWTMSQLAQRVRKIQAQEVLSQSSFYSASDPRLHFGLGGETSADLEIRWPSGMRQTLKGVEANQIVTIKEGTGIVMNQKSVRA